MQIIKDNLRLTFLSAITCICLLFSLSNYGDEPESSQEKSSAQILQEYYLDFWYWMEGISLAQFMLSEERYADRSLELDDLKRIYTLSFTASHVLNPYLFNLRNAFYSAAYQGGKPYNHDELPDQYHQRHKEYIDWLHGLHEFMSPYHTQKDLKKNFKQVFEDTYKDSYPDSYEQYKHLLVHHSASTQPHIAGLGDKRARQWLKYEIADAIYSETKEVVAALENITEYQACQGLSMNQTSVADTGMGLGDYGLSSLHLTPLKSTLRVFIQRPLVKNLLPEIHKNMQHIVESSVDDLTTSMKAARNLLRNVSAERESNRPPYGIASTSMAFSRVKKLHGIGLHLHTISTLTLEELEFLRDDIAAYRSTIRTRAITPVILMRELGITPK